MNDSICEHMLPRDQCLSCLRAELYHERKATQNARAEIARLRAENERLRETLEEIASHDDQHRETCRAALAAGGE